MKHPGHRPSRIQLGFCTLFSYIVFSSVLAYTPQAMAGNGILIATPSKLNFGAVPVGGSEAMSATVTNPGGPKMTIFNAILTGTGFTLSGLKYPLTLAGGQSVKCTITFSPQLAGSFNGNLSVSFFGGGGGKGNSGSGTVNVPLSGTGNAQVGQLSANPGSLNFGNVQVAHSQSLSEAIINSGSQTVHISQATVSGAGFSISGLTPPVSLDPGQSVTFSASFTPQSAGPVNGNISITSDAPNLTIPLAGNGTASGQLSAAPSSYNFGNVNVGTSASTKASLNATGATVTVNSVSFSDAEFVISGISFPIAIPAGQSAVFTVTFSPQTSGTVSASATFASDASNSPTVFSLSGAGTAPQQHRVDLSWSQSPSPNVIGYNVYRSSTPGGPYGQINSGLNSGTAFSDSSVSPGQTYYYVTTAVDANNMESGYSNQSTAVIPSP